jgi:hypothetical protein
VPLGLADLKPAAPGERLAQRPHGGRVDGDPAQQQRAALGDDLLGEPGQPRRGGVEEVGGLAQLAAAGELQRAAMADQRGERREPVLTAGEQSRLAAEGAQRRLGPGEGLSRERAGGPVQLLPPWQRFE